MGILKVLLTPATLPICKEVSLAQLIAWEIWSCIQTHKFKFSFITTREQTLERCPNLALASAFFGPGTKGPFSPGW